MNNSLNERERKELEQLRKEKANRINKKNKKKFEKNADFSTIIITSIISIFASAFAFLSWKVNYIDKANYSWKRTPEKAFIIWYTVIAFLFVLSSIFMWIIYFKERKEMNNNG